MRYTILCAIIISLASCETKNASATRRAVNSLSDLIGKTVEYRYGESVYHVTFDSDSTMHWEAMAGEEKGVLEHEKYVAEFIQPGKMFISWGEANGINVSQVLDFNAGKVYSHLVQERKPSMGGGEIMLIN